MGTLQGWDTHRGLYLDTIWSVLPDVFKINRSSYLGEFCNCKDGAQMSVLGYDVGSLARCNQDKYVILPGGIL